MTLFREIQETTKKKYFPIPSLAFSFNLIYFNLIIKLNYKLKIEKQCPLFNFEILKHESIV